ncbi:hypothetical protein C2G38_2161850 [Gigaspora rosea]|uniref:Uncharacterized protein n=1 Tax=Gigaspora rosea TaxID=44941 RepID=A0A397VWJ4_9GLOM|nr:hypothetical protein C2G38_2161850 [Gigaspora rosea]
MLEATNINYVKTAAVIYNAHENYFLTTPGAQSIIDIIANDIESKLNQVLKVVNPTIPRNQKQLSNYVDLDAQNEKDTELNEEEESHPYKRKEEIG